MDAVPTKRTMVADAAAPVASRKRRKQQKTAAADAGQWKRCMFRIVRKNRFCNIERCVDEG